MVGVAVMSPLKALRLVAFLEGMSFLLLLLIAMPLKYVWDMKLGVRILGPVHGLLFVAFLGAVWHAGLERDWPLRRYVWALVASLIPGGTFVLDRSLKSEQQSVGDA
jgi:integral membrane protein